MLNASLTTSSSYRRCSKRRILDHSAQATSRLQIEGTMKHSLTALGSGCGSTTESAADLRLRQSNYPNKSGSLVELYIVPSAWRCESIPHTNPNAVTIGCKRGIVSQSTDAGTLGRRLLCQRCSTRCRTCTTTCLPCGATSRIEDSGYVSQRSPDSFPPQVLDPTRQISWRLSQD